MTESELNVFFPHFNFQMLGNLNIGASHCRIVSQVKSRNEMFRNPKFWSGGKIEKQFHLLL